MENIQNFFETCNVFMSNTANIHHPANSKLICEAGFDLITKTNELGLKEKILNKLLFFYPKNHTIYHKMGTIFKGLDLEKEMLWYKLCFGIKPDYLENFYALCNLYLDVGLSNHVYELNVDNLFENFKNDPHFLTVYVRCELIKLNYKNGLKCLLELIKLNSQKQCKTPYDRNEKWRNYHDAGYIFSASSDVDNCLKYTQKAIDLSLKFDLDLNKKLLSFQNFLCFSDYMYADNEKLFQIYLNINEYIPDRPLFSFKNRTKNNLIRIGYISSDFVMHSVTNFILPIIKHHNKKFFEIYLFSNADKVDDSYKSLDVKIIEINRLNNKEAAEMINKHKIDILFDLNGHTVKNRLEIFTYHPAPIQISYLGYPNTTGLKGIQYRITDSIADSPLSKQRYSEKLIRLPKCFLLYNSIHKFEINPRKTKSKIILGCVNKENKTNQELLEVWKTILERCPNTIILIKLESFDNKEERTQFYLDKLCITKDRIIVLAKLTNPEYEKVFTMFDIMMDPFPYSGTTTTCNSLLNSIPVVTLYHPDYHVTNVSSSLLINCGLGELVANSKEEYMDIVVNLVNNPDKIDEYKRTIRDSFLKLMEPKPFMDSFEFELTRVYNNLFIDKNENVSKKIDVINIDFSETVSAKKVLICGCVKDCAQYLERVFLNINKMIPLFDDYKIVVAEDSSSDNTVEILNNLKRKYKLEIINVEENILIKDFTLRSQRISNARNKLLQYVYNKDQNDFKYFVMMDMDDVSVGSMDQNVLKMSLERDNDWDALSFNRKNYYDIWALSIDPYVCSCWHFPGGFDIVKKITNYVSNRLKNLDKNSLLKCTSAFNGFSIYKKDKFINCEYDWRIKKNFDKISKDLLRKNENALGRNFTIDKSYHEIIHPTTDCEHRYFHMKAIENNGARIRISPLCLFKD